MKVVAPPSCLASIPLNELQTWPSRTSHYSHAPTHPSPATYKRPKTALLHTPYKPQLPPHTILPKSSRRQNIPRSYPLASAHLPLSLLLRNNTKKKSQPSQTIHPAEHHPPNPHALPNKEQENTHPKQNGHHTPTPPHPPHPLPNPLQRPPLHPLANHSLPTPRSPPLAPFSPHDLHAHLPFRPLDADTCPTRGPALRFGACQSSCGDDGDTGVYEGYPGVGCVVGISGEYGGK